MRQTTMNSMIATTLYTVVFLVLSPLASEATGLRRLRRNQALVVPDLAAPKTPTTATTSRNSRLEAFGLVQDELEEVFLQEIFRMDASMSFLSMDMSMSMDFGGGMDSEDETIPAATEPPVASPATSAPAPDIVDIAAGAGSFSILVDLVTTAGLVDTLKSPGPFTVFAPTDDAFNAAIPDLEAFKAETSQEDLVAILTYHVIPGTILSTDLVDGAEVATVEGSTVSIGTSMGPMVNNANIVTADISASNGVIHVIDTVLLPPGPSTPAPSTPGASVSDAAEDDGSAIFQKCGVSESERSASFMVTLSTISDLALLQDSTTAQYQAMNWLDKDDAAAICPGNDMRIIQRYVAALIYFQFDGNNWANCRANGGSCFQEGSTSVPAIPFLSPSSECVWYGLTCADTPREVTPDQSDLVSVDDYSPILSVDIPDNNLSGPLFDELFTLTNIQELTLDGNKNIGGTIPESISQLTSLVAIDIDDNSLIGTLPESLYSMTSLEAIDLNDNQLSGSISNDIGNLSQLVVVQLDGNNFTGEMPTDGLFQLENLAVWTVVNNNLQGTVEPVCDVLEERRSANGFPGYLQFFWVDCLGNPPPVECSCCECEEPDNPTSF